ncbi:CLUMA_CG014524, isoform A [Clunio marinus]|uniref:CLUMA_CG014524, isoform A n=1 Tax=Clunio marinus TaxID=568069 RepID=A0A1J1ILV6_9DIPT|nr:CLUMA_CG014524, isoform A [Clunio marinus]
MINHAGILKSVATPALSRLAVDVAAFKSNHHAINLGNLLLRIVYKAKQQKKKKPKRMTSEARISYITRLIWKKGV